MVSVASYQYRAAGARGQFGEGVPNKTSEVFKNFGSLALERLRLA